MSLKHLDEKYFKNAEDYIPVGIYCRDCIFLDKDETKPYLMNGYCHYLKRGDWQISSETILVDLKTGEEIPREVTSNIPIGLLWDGCKECGIKDYEEWCIDCKYSYEFSGYSCKCKLLDKVIENTQVCCENFEPYK